MKAVSNDRVFVDTNILFYANDPASPFGKQAIARINELASLNNELIISSQIIREYAAATLRNAGFHKLDLKVITAIVLRNIARFQRDFEVLYDGPEVLQKWATLLPMLTTGKDVFDFNIAATLQANGIRNILTHNEKDFVKFDSWLNVLPLISDSEAILTGG
jgi:predicted nucleic acid-binding protein